MKSFVRRICRVFLIISITGLLTLIGGATTLLGLSSTAYANQAPCPNGYHQTGSSCTPNAAYYCPSAGQVWSPKDNSCISEASNPNTCNPGYTWQDPDNAQQCLPDSQLCGSASYYDPARKLCIVQSPIPLPQ
jgi:hypothetical protein